MGSSGKQGWLVAILSMLVRKASSEQVTLEQSPEGEGVICADLRGRRAIREWYEDVQTPQAG